MRDASVISAPVARAVLSGASSKGCDSPLLLARLGIRPTQEDDVWLLAKFTAALEAAAVERRNALFGLSLGKSFALNGLGPVGILMRASSNAAEAFTKLGKFFPQNNTAYSFSVSDHTARISYLITDPTITQRRQDAELTIAQQLAILSELLGAAVYPIRVNFQHCPSDQVDVGEYRAQLNCDVGFGRQENAVYLACSYMQKVSRHADADISRTLEAELVQSSLDRRRQRDFSAAIEGWITSEISSGQSVSIRKAASEFGMSVRSFQRELFRDQVNYLELRNAVHLQIANCLLCSTLMSVTSIASYLGYTETSAFSRYFKQIAGVSPAQFRKRTHPVLLLRKAGMASMPDLSD